ncbi:zinc ribbon domain-containing protein [Ideonella sp. DXS29W]|uniref:Zinc ribbon domain-containing protein n=1 Tax=Ideonella lacteola TaxID=2984193 RepID=A0ABU9BTR8_9BURK
MPLYDFHCRACQAGFELLVRGGAAPQCPACGSTDLERAISRIAPAGKTAALVASGRRQAAREGHFSHYSASERAKVPR